MPELLNILQCTVAGNSATVQLTELHWSWSWTLCKCRDYAILRYLQAIASEPPDSR